MILLIVTINCACNKTHKIYYKFIQIIDKNNFSQKNQLFSQLIKIQENSTQFKRQKHLGYLNNT